MTYSDYTMQFETISEAVALYDLVKLPVAGQDYYSGYRYDDNGEKVRIFARKHFGNVAKFTFSEKA